MRDIVHKIYTEVLIGFVAICHLRVIIIEMYEKYHGVEEFIERRFIKRRKTDMANPIADIQLALTILAEVRQALPIVAKSIQDLKQTFTDKSDPSKAATDLNNVLNDLEPLLNQVLALVPPQAA